MIPGTIHDIHMIKKIRNTPETLNPKQREYNVYVFGPCLSELLKGEQRISCSPVSTLNLDLSD